MNIQSVDQTKVDISMNQGVEASEVQLCNSLTTAEEKIPDSEELAYIVNQDRGKIWMPYNCVYNYENLH